MRTIGRSRAAAAGFAVAMAIMIGAAGCGGSGGNVDDESGDPTFAVVGATQTVSGAQVSSWARVDRNGVVQEVGVTLPLAVARNPPASHGSGPAGAHAVLPFPAAARNGTYFNHFELQWEPEGHPPALFSVPHFDLHFYAVSPDEVEAVTAQDPVAPAPERVPAGYLYTGQSVPEMGVHAIPLALVNSGQPFTTAMIAGFYGGSMTFLEPMVTQEFLLQRQNVVMDVPRPAVLGRATRYPTRFRATYQASTDSYDLVFSDFVTVTR